MMMSNCHYLQFGVDLAACERILADVLDFPEHAFYRPQHKALCVFVEDYHGKAQGKGDEQGPNNIEDAVEL